jgi:hypothetical protein
MANNNGRKPKVQVEEPELTTDDVWSVLDFARSMLNYPSYLTPDLISSRMKDVTLNPMAATEDSLNKALANPKESELQLREFSQDFELKSMVYKRLIAYMADMLAFDITYTSDAEPKDYDTPKYKKDLKAVEDTLEKFPYKKELGIAVKQMVRNDGYFACIRDVGDNFILQELPSEYCKITGRWAGGLLFSFNMYWFLLPGVDINMYPDFFKKKYVEIWGKPNMNKPYVPSLPPELRSSTWIYWVDVPIDVGVCFKYTPELATRLPYFTPLFSDLILQSLMRNLQKNASMAAASKMIIGQVPMLSKDVKATVKDSIAISPDLLGKFMALVKSAINESIRVASAPLEDMKGVSFDSENELYDSYLKTTLASSGVNTNLIFTSDIKPNVLETQLSLNVDEQMMTDLYQQFNIFMNYFINKFTKTYKFSFTFEGTQFFLNRQQRLESAMTLFNVGIVLPQKIAAAIGMRPSQLRKHMEEAAATGFMSMLTPPALEGQKQMAEITAKQQKELADQTAKNQQETAEKAAKTQAKLNPKVVPGQANPAKPAGQGTPAKPAGSTSNQNGKTTDTGQPAKEGRPTKDISKISEETEQTRTEGSNLGRGGQV